MFRALTLIGITAAAMSLAAPVFAADENKPDEATAAATAAAATRHAELFDKLDANHDGFISSDEVPAAQKRLFDRLLRRSEKTSDGKLSRDEFISGMAEDRTKDRPFPSPGERPDGKTGPPEGGGHGRRMMMGPLFQTLDLNGDGKLDDKEIAAAAESLNKLAKNGEITREELMQAARESMPGGFGPGGPGGPGRPDFDPEKAAKRMIQRLDKSGDGKLQKDELPQHRQESFDKLDANHDGVLDEDEMKAAMPQIMQRMAEKQRAGTSRHHKGAGHEKEADDKQPAQTKPDDKQADEKKTEK